MASPESATVRGRRQRAAATFHDGILLFHASSKLEMTADGFRQYHFSITSRGWQTQSGPCSLSMERSGESWLFLPSEPALLETMLQPEVEPGADSQKRLAIEHVVDWSTFRDFLASRASQGVPLYYAHDFWTLGELLRRTCCVEIARGPESAAGASTKVAGLFEAKEVAARVQGLMEIQSADEIAALRSAATATVRAFMAGVGAVRPGRSQRSVEAVVENSCWNAGVHGSSFWPWAMAGDNGVFPHPFTSLGAVMNISTRICAPAIWFRLDVGCEWDHYIGDLGEQCRSRATITTNSAKPGPYSWPHIALGAAVLRRGATVDQIFDGWRSELLSHSASARSPLAGTRSIPGPIARMFLIGKCTPQT